jgi:hypothetical protein
MMMSAQKQLSAILSVIFVLCNSVTSFLLMHTNKEFALIGDASTGPWQNPSIFSLDPEDSSSALFGGETPGRHTVDSDNTCSESF